MPVSALHRQLTGCACRVCVVGVCRHPVDVDLLHAIFKKELGVNGSVLRIVVMRHRGVQALIEFDNVGTATRAKEALHNRDIYGWCNTLKVEYSASERVNVRYNTKDMRDYTGLNLQNEAGAVQTADGAAAAFTAEIAATADTADTAAKTCSCAACGNELLGEAAAENRCSRCKQAFYCGRTCQKRHWGRGGHKLVCEEAPCCTICLEGGDAPLPMQCGCGCRGDAGLAHVACIAQAAAHQAASWNTAWEECLTCGQYYTGGMQLGLARERVRRTERRAPGDDDRLAARWNLGQALLDAGEHAGAEVLLRDVLAVRRRVDGRSHRSTRLAATTLADVLDLQGQRTEAVALYRETLAATPADEQETTNTLVGKGKLAAALSGMGDHAEAEALLRGVIATQERLYGPDDARTLQSVQTAQMLGRVLQDQSKHTDAAAVYRPTLAAQRRVLGPEHPETLRTAYDLAVSLAQLGEHAEAEELLQGVLQMQQRTKGTGNEGTLLTAAKLAEVRAKQTGFWGAHQG